MVFDFGPNASNARQGIKTQFYQGFSPGAIAVRTPPMPDRALRPPFILHLL